MIGEEPFEPLSLAIPESLIPVAPENEGGLVAQPAKVRFHLSKEFASVADLPWEDRRWQKRGTRWERPLVGAHFRRRKSPTDARGQEHVDECIEIEHEKTSDFLGIHLSGQRGER